MLFILEHNTSIMGSMNSIIGKNCGKFQKAFFAKFSAYFQKRNHKDNFVEDSLNCILDVVIHIDCFTYVKNLTITPSFCLLFQYYICM